MEAAPLAGLTKTLRALLKVNIGIVVIAVLVDYYPYTKSPADVRPNEGFSDDVIGIVGLIQFVSLMIVGITFLRWIYRTNKNLHILSNEQMEFTPGWAVGWYFIPIANLFMPYQVMKEIWRVSHKNEPTASSLLGWWWFLWIASHILALIALEISKRPEIVGDVASTIVYIAPGAIEVILNIVGLMLVTQIWMAYSRSIGEFVQNNV